MKKTKKLLAIFITLTMLLLSLFTGVSAEQGTVYDLFDEFMPKEFVNWSFAVQAENGSFPYRHQYWSLEASDPGSAEKVDAYTPFGGGLGAFPVCIVTAGDNQGKLTWMCGCDLGDMMLMFTAPETAEYTLDFATVRMWAQEGDGSKFYVKVNDTVIENTVTTVTDTTEVTFHEVLKLEKGDVVYIAHNGAGTNYSDSAYITKCELTVSGEYTPEPDPADSASDSSNVVPEESEKNAAPEDNEKKQDNTAVIIIGIAAAVLLVAAVVIVIVKKKK